MAYEKRTRTFEKIAGFWTRESDSVLEGTLIKFISPDRKDSAGYYLFKTIAAGTPLQPNNETGQAARDAQVGEVVAVSGCAALDVIKEEMLDCKGSFKLVSSGEKDGKKGRTFWDIDVEYDDSYRPRKEPF